MLKHLGPASKELFLNFLHQSGTPGRAPAIWKEAQVIPTPKKGKDNRDPRSYRPIRLLSCVRKLMERMINQRLIHHLETHGLLSPTRTGCRKHTSTEDQLTYLAQERKCRECLSREKGRSGRVLRFVASLRQGVEEGSPVDTLGAWSAKQDVHVDSLLPLSQVFTCET